MALSALLASISTAKDPITEQDDWLLYLLQNLPNLKNVQVSMDFKFPKREIEEFQSLLSLLEVSRAWRFIIGRL